MSSDWLLGSMEAGSIFRRKETKRQSFGLVQADFNPIQTETAWLSCSVNSHKPHEIQFLKDGSKAALRHCFKRHLKQLESVSPAAKRADWFKKQFRAGRNCTGSASVLKKEKAPT